MKDSESNKVKNPGPRQSHHLDLPKVGRVTCHVEETPCLYSVTCHFPARLTPRLINFLTRWLAGVIVPLERDSRPMWLKVYRDGQTVCEGFTTGNFVAILGGLAS